MPTIVAIRHQFDALPDEAQSHLSKLRPILERAELEIALSYLFMMIEQGRYRAIKCALIRKLKCNSQIIDEKMKNHELTRKSFHASMKLLLSIDINKGDFAVLAKAEAIRDRAVHGRRPSANEMRQALQDALRFVSLFGSEMKTKTGKNPFGNLQGLTSKMKLLNKQQSLWIVRGVLQSAIQNPPKPAESPK